MAYTRQGRPARPAADQPKADRRAAGQTRPARAGQKNSSRRKTGELGAWFRMLPVVICTAVIMLTVRVNDLWEAWRDGRTQITFASAAVAEAKPPVQIAAETKAPAAGAAKTAEKTGTNSQPLDPIMFSRSEIELLQELSKRRKELDAREQTVVQREGLLTAAEARIERRLAALGEVKTEIEGLIKKYEAQEEKELKNLVLIYEKMKPKEAARIFDQLEMDVLLKVIDRMKSTKTAPVLAAMAPERAKELTMRIAERRPMPKLK